MAEAPTKPGIVQPTGTAGPLVKLEKVSRVYHAGKVDVTALCDADLEIGTGEHIAIMGRSGSGKSTLMNIIGCLDQPTSGHYYLNGQDTAAMDDDTISRVRGKTIGFVFQSFHLLRGVSILENVELPMEYQGVPPRIRKERAAVLLERVGLGHRLTHRPNELSGGERQRVAIARSLANEPLLLLADEPTGNLDSRAQEKILELFLELHEEMGVTMVLVTHDAAVAETAQRVVRISDGRIKTPETSRLG